MNAEQHADNIVKLTTRKDIINYIRAVEAAAVAAAQRTIEAQAVRISELEATLKDIATAPYENQPNDGDEWEKEYYLRGMHR